MRGGSISAAGSYGDLTAAGVDFHEMQLAAEVGPRRVMG